MRRSGHPLAFVIALVAILVTLVLAACGGSGTQTQPSGSAWAAAPGGATVVSLYVSPEKEALMRGLVDQYNATNPKVAGRRVFVEGHTISSGEAETKLANGQLKPTVWSPAGSLWGRLLDFQLDRGLAPATNPSIVRTPLVIAMWKPMAQALGWPSKPLGFADLSRLARDPRGWGAVGHPEFGPFALVHTNPDFSTAGLESVVAEYYAQTRRRTGLTDAEVTAARPAVAALEHSIIHYGDTTLFVADQLVKDGTGYASAAILEEATLLDVNRRLQEAHSANQLVAIYPKEGTFFSDSPYIVLDAPWVSPAQREAADAFGRWLTAHITASMAARYGFRPADPALAPAPPITAANGVDPAQPKRLLGLPAPHVLNSVKVAWRADRKPANVLLLLDTTGSMGESGKLDGAKQGLQVFLAQAGAQDEVGLTTFATGSRVQVPIGRMSANRDRLSTAIDSLQADGNTALYDAVSSAFSQLRSHRDPSHINALVVLTDGQDNSSSKTLADVVNEVRAQGDSRNQVRVFTIAYGSDADNGVLSRIADASGGKAYTGDPSNIQSVYQSISSFF